MTERLRVCEIDDDEGRRLVRIVRRLRSLYPPAIRIAIICGNFSPHLTIRQRRPGRRLGRGEQRGDRLYADQFIVVKPREVQFTALRYFALDNTGHPSHKVQASLIRR